jgi:hypothetical protein
LLEAHTAVHCGLSTFTVDQADKIKSLPTGRALAARLANSSTDSVDVVVHGLEVRLQRALVREAKIAVLARKRFRLSSVRADVPVEIALVARAVVALLAGKGLLLRVRAQVPRQLALLGKPQVAVLASKRLLSSVHSHVLDQGALLSESRIALLARKRLLPSVHPHVRRQDVLGGGLEVALLARKRFVSSVAPQVPHEAALLVGAEIAVRAGKRLLPSVQPYVRHQITLAFSAVGALLAGKGFLPGVQLPLVPREGFFVVCAKVAILGGADKRLLRHSVHPQVLRQALFVGGLKAAVLTRVRHLRKPTRAETSSWSVC